MQSQSKRNGHPPFDRALACKREGAAALQPKAGPLTDAESAVLGSLGFDDSLIDADGQFQSARRARAAQRLNDPIDEARLRRLDDRILRPEIDGVAAAIFVVLGIAMSSTV